MSDIFKAPSIGGLSSRREMPRRVSRGFSREWMTNYPRFVTIHVKPISQQVGGNGGSFFTLFEQDGDTYLQGGQVKGGEGNEVIDAIKVIDGTTGPLGTANQHLIIEATGNGEEDDDGAVVLPIWELTSATTDIVTTIPDDTFPELGNLTGKKCHIDLGQFTDETFLPAEAGTKLITWCFNGYKF